MAGSVTLIGTRSNVVIAGIAGERGVDMTMLSFAAVALPVALAGAVVVHGDHEPRDQRRHGVIVTPVALRLAAGVNAALMTILALVGTCVSFTFINPYATSPSSW